MIHTDSCSRDGLMKAHPENFNQDSPLTHNILLDSRDHGLSRYTAVAPTTGQLHLTPSYRVRRPLPESRGTTPLVPARYVGALHLHRFEISGRFHFAITYFHGSSWLTQTRSSLATQNLEFCGSHALRPMPLM